MRDGWIKLYRKSIDSQVFKNPYLWQLWTWCLMKANHEECWMNVRTGRGETQVHLKPGQFIFGRHSAAKELGWPPSTVRNRLTLLGNMQNLDNQKGEHYSIVSIRNWDIYQTPEKDSNHAKRTTKGQPKDTNKNNKNKVSKDTCRQKADPNVKTFILEWGEIWSKKFEKPYTPDWGKEGKLVKGMLNIHSFQELRELRDEFFRSENSFVKGSDYSIGIFKTQINKLITARKLDPIEQAREEMRNLEREERPKGRKEGEGGGEGGGGGGVNNL